MFAQISNETKIDEYIDFDFVTVTSEPAVNTQNIDWREESRERRIAEVMHLSKVPFSYCQKGDVFLFI